VTGKKTKKKTKKVIAYCMRDPGNLFFFTLHPTNIQEGSAEVAFNQMRIVCNKLFMSNLQKYEMH